MIRPAAIEGLHPEGTRRASFEAATCSNSPLRSARKARWVRISGLAVSFFLFASTAASQEERDSFIAGLWRSSSQSMKALRVGSPGAWSTGWPQYQSGSLGRWRKWIR